jgi:cytoskeletal protein RodZ
VSDLGQLLKKARFEKGIKLEELQETTKIQKRYLEAIEEGNFSLLPGNFYVRAFIKSYSEAVGLDPDEVIRLYRDVIPAPSVESHAEPSRKNRRKSFNTDRISKWASTLLMWFFPLLIVAFIYIYFTNYYEGKPPIQEEQTGITDELEPPEEEQAPEQEFILPDPIVEPEEEVEAPPEPQISYVNTDASTYIYNASNVEILKVELKVIGTNCWVWVKENNNEGPVIVEKTYTKDHIETWEADHSLWVRMGNPGNVEIRINDVLIDREKLLESNPWNLQINLVNDNNTD